jgi:NADH:ubiquinone oxidoreductase subunit D
MFPQVRSTPQWKLQRGNSASIWSQTDPIDHINARFVHHPFLTIQAMDFLCKGQMLGDVSAILGSLDIVFGEIDR